MSVHRSPVNKYYGSTPDLSTRSDGTLNDYVVCRKRKEPDNEIKQEINNFRIEMMSFLQNLNDSQSEKLNKMSADINEIEIQLCNVEQVCETLALDHVKLREELTNVKIDNEKTIKQVHLLEK